MALIKSNTFFTSLMILLALFGVAVGGTVHKVGDSSGWTMMGVNYEAWASSRTFQVGDSLVFEYNNGFHDVTEVTHNNFELCEPSKPFVTEVTHNDFELCEPSKPLAKYQTGSDTISLTKPGYQNFICGFPSHCDIGQKLQILVLPASLGPFAAPVPGPVRSPTTFSSSLSPVNNVPQHQMGPPPTPHSAAATSSVWIGFSYFLLSLFILV
uniref:Phytocyanin domain-containing protein n=1 Tax=Brassica campestris TaxID=3711 RepID=M4DYM0_BRACM